MANRATLWFILDIQGWFWLLFWLVGAIICSFLQNIWWLNVFIKFLFQLVLKTLTNFETSNWLIAELLPILWCWHLGGTFLALALGAIFCSSRLDVQILDTILVVEMDYKMFVPIGFQVWSICRSQMVTFAELLAILWFWPLKTILPLASWEGLNWGKYTCNIYRS